MALKSSRVSFLFADKNLFANKAEVVKDKRCEKSKCRQNSKERESEDKSIDRRRQNTSKKDERETKEKGERLKGVSEYAKRKTQ